MAATSSLPVPVGILGAGFVGSALAHALIEDPRYDVRFIHARSRGRLTEALGHLWVARSGLRDAVTDVEIVIEAAHPVLTETYGEHIATHANYLTMSTAALVDDGLRRRIIAAAGASGHELLLPHGALVGLESLEAGKQSWRDVTISFVKNPVHIETAAGTSLAADTDGVVYEGPVRGIASRFPRNVNSMVTLALATVGLDRAYARLIARPGVDRAELAVDASGADGSMISVRKRQPMGGVSGTEMVASTIQSMAAASRVAAPGLRFV